MPDADTIIAELGLRPHPEGGHNAETWRADTGAGQRPQLVVPAGFRFKGFELAAPDREPGR